MSTEQPGGSHVEEKAPILTEEELLARIRPADVVIGVNLHNGEETVYYGLEHLQTGAKGRVEKIPVNYETDEPDMLAAACVTAKGSCDYGKGGSKAPQANV